MIDKHDIIHFADSCKLESMVSALVIVTDGKRVCPYVEGKQAALVASLIMVARANSDFELVLKTAVGYLGEEGGEE